MTQVTLTPDEIEAIQAVSKRNGKALEDVVHEAIEQFLTRNHIESRLAALRKARGIWKDRDDLPDFGAIRREWDRD